MSLSEICIKRPVLSIVMTLLMVIVGAVSYTYLQLRQFPQIDKPVISVTTQYEGASPKIIESRVTKLLESSLAGIEGIDFITSVSDSENSRINLYFKPARDIDAAANDVRDKIGRVRMRLPEGARDSVIKKSDADSEAILYLVLYTDNKDISVAELYDYTHHYLENELEAIGGVAAVDPFGSTGHVIHVYLDPIKMGAHRITTQDISAALKQQNVHIPAGKLKGDDREYAVSTSANLKNVEAFKNVILQREKGHLIRLQDVARVEFSSAETKSIVRFNGKPAIAIGLIKKSVANPLQISSELQEKLPRIRKDLPKDYKIDIAYDKTVFIEQSLDEVKKTFFEAAFFVCVVILLFLWSVRATLIPLVTIPVCIISTFSLLYIFGFSLNTLTLLAIVLAIGLVVDDAIVMMENIFRYIDEGMTPFKAAMKGSKEISFAIIAMTLTLGAVYAPIALAQGMIGKVFTEFALTLAGAVMISGFVALTLSPMMCAYLLKPHMSHAPAPRRRSSKEEKLTFWQRIKQKLSSVQFDKGYKKVETLFESTLRRLMDVRGPMLTVALLFSLTGGVIALKFIPSELVPAEDQGIINSGAMVPDGATIEYMSRYMAEIEDILKDVPEIQNQLLLLSPPNPLLLNRLIPWKDRKRSSVEIIDSLRAKIKDVAGVNAYLSPGSSMLGSSGKNDDSIQFVLQTTKSQQELDTASEILEYALRKAKILPFLKTDRAADTQEYVVEIDRHKAGLLGVDVNAIGETYDTFISGRRVTDFKKEHEQFDVVASVAPSEKRAPTDLSHLYVRGRQRDREVMIPLSNLVELKREVIPIQINHYNQLRSVTLGGELSPGYSLGDAVEKFQTLSEELLPEGIRADFSGSTQQFLKARYTIYMIFGLALAFIFLVMAAQFESFTDPFIIMFTVPLSLAGAVITLKLVGGSINIYSQIGLITLIGLITKHGILIVDFANKIRDNEPKVTKIDAAIRATLLRLRPILMTTAAMVLGAVPLVYSTGAGAESRRQIGWVIFGGMLIGTLFTLFVIPAIYSFMARDRKKTEG